jgi:gluconate 2-dehydrogenase gamma chain
LGDKPNSNSRRDFLRSTLVGISTATLSTQVPVVLADQKPGEKPGHFCNESELRFLESAVDRLIPPDERWPGASGAGVAEYIDRQLAGPWGRGEQLYRHGPFHKGLPTQGYQLEYTWAELFRRSINAVNHHFTTQGTSFARLTNEQKDAYLASLEKGGIDLDGVPSDTFFEALLKVTVQGFFADPMYGGNKDMVGWRMIGFPGAYADYFDLIDKHGMEFKREPLSIADRESPYSSVHRKMARS